MQKVKYVYWQDNGMWLGYLAEYPEYWTEGENLDDLQEHLMDLFRDLSQGKVPAARRVGELVIS